MGPTQNNLQNSYVNKALFFANNINNNNNKWEGFRNMCTEIQEQLAISI